MKKIRNLLILILVLIVVLFIIGNFVLPLLRWLVRLIFGVIALIAVGALVFIMIKMAKEKK